MVLRTELRLRIAARQLVKSTRNFGTNLTDRAIFHFAPHSPQWQARIYEGTLSGRSVEGEASRHWTYFLEGKRLMSFMELNATSGTLISLTIHSQAEAGNARPQSCHLTGD
jgi:hypothetical protein